MNKANDWTEFLSAFDRLLLAYGKQPNSELTAEYWEELAEFPIRWVLEAFSQAKRECQYFPKIAQVYAMARSRQPTLPPKQEPRPTDGGPRARTVTGKFLRELIALLPSSGSGLPVTMNSRDRRNALERFKLQRLPDLQAEWAEADRMDKGGPPDSPQRAMNYYPDGTPVPEEAPF